MTTARLLIRPLAALLVLLALPLSGCMFAMEHKFPEGTRFDRERHVRVVRRVEDSRMKNYLLAGLLPWTRFGTKDIAEEPGAGRHLSGTQVETTFNALDTVIWVVPGFFYGYYVWAPRHVGVSADVVQEGEASLLGQH
jgi:hypothetical protein